MGYQVTDWKDHVTEYENRYRETANPDGSITHTKEEGEIIQQGTPLSATYFLNMEYGIKDAQEAAALLLNGLRQGVWRIEALEKATIQEVGTKTLTNTQSFPFNNSVSSVALTNIRDNLNYVVVIVSVTGDGNVGEVEVTDRLVNGFKLAYTGSAKNVTVKYAVIGGYE